MMELAMNTALFPSVVSDDESTASTIGTGKCHAHIGNTSGESLVSLLLASPGLCLEKPACRQRKLRPCIKKDGPAPNERKKSVKFASRGQTHKVHCAVKLIKKHSRACKHALWWTSAELDYSFDLHLEAASLVETRYRDLLGCAYDSSFAADSVEHIDLPFGAMKECSVARGLESTFFDELFDKKMEHRGAVLDAQDLFWGAGDPEAAERLICKQSLKFSRSSQLMAQKLAEFDAQFIQ